MRQPLPAVAIAPTQTAGKSFASRKEETATGPAGSLLAFLRSKVNAAIAPDAYGGAPWEERHLILAHEDLELHIGNARTASEGFTVVPRPLKGKRVSVKGPRHSANRSGIKASWPSAGVQALQQPVIIFVLEGHTDLQIGDYLVHCAAGHFIYIAPGLAHTDGSHSHLEPENLPHGACSLLWFSPSATAGLGCWVCHSRGESHFERAAESCYVPDHRVLAIFDLLAEEVASGRPGHRTICARLLEALIYSVCREIEAGRIFQFAFQKADSGLGAQRTGVTDPIAEARAIIRDNFHRPLIIEEVARRVFLSRTEFTTRFRRETGKTFTQFLTEVRLEEARALLANTQWSIAIIGESTGLLSSRLRVLFRQTYGVSPQEFRRLHANAAARDIPLSRRPRKPLEPSEADSKKATKQRTR